MNVKRISRVNKMNNNGKDDSHEGQVFKLMNGDVQLWIEQATIHLVAFDHPNHDPVELTARMARVLAAKLEQMAQRIED